MALLGPLMPDYAAGVAAGGGGGGGGETDPPTDTGTAPVGSTYYDVAAEAFVIEVDDASALAFVSIAVKFSDRQATELAYAGIGPSDPAPGHGFVAPYENSTVAGSMPTVFNVKRTGGWPPDVAASFTVRAVDEEGNVL